MMHLFFRRCLVAAFAPLEIMGCCLIGAIDGLVEGCRHTRDAWTGNVPLWWESDQ